MYEQIKRISINMGCHQLPERSFFFRGKKFPVCARCTGVAIGQFSTIILFFFTININLFISMLFMLVMFIDWFVQYKFNIESTNGRRLITGILGGAGLTALYLKIIVVSYNQVSLLLNI